MKLIYRPLGLRGLINSNRYYRKFQGAFFFMKNKTFTKKELSDAVVLLMQLYQIELHQAVYYLDNDEEQLKNSLKKLMLFNMNTGKEAYLETAMQFVEDKLNELQNV